METASRGPLLNRPRPETWTSQLVDGKDDVLHSCQGRDGLVHRSLGV
jgi:hypothetical protein